VISDNTRQLTENMSRRRAKVKNPVTDRYIYIDGKTFDKLVKDGYALEGNRLVTTNFKPKDDINQEDCERIISILNEAHENHLVKIICQNQFTGQLSSRRVSLMCEVRRVLEDIGDFLMTCGDENEVGYPKDIEDFYKSLKIPLYSRYLRYEYKKSDIFLYFNAVRYVDIIISEAKKANIKDEAFYHNCNLLLGKNLVNHYLVGGKHISDMMRDFYPATLLDCLYMYFSIKFNIGNKGLAMHDDMCYIIDKKVENHSKAVNGVYRELYGDRMYALRFR
jgi:hypothetical protein